MLSIRLEAMINGYKRKLSNTEQFVSDLSLIDKLCEMVNNKKDYYKIRNKYLDCIDVFSLESIHEFIYEYNMNMFDDESLDLYYSVYREIIQIEMKRN